MIPRNENIDKVRGLAIICVIYGHLIQILLSAFQYDFFNDPIEKFICSFHMPVFACISGYLLFYSIKKPVKGYIKSKINGLLYPLLIWETVHFLLMQVIEVIIGNGFNLSFSGYLSVLTGNFLWFLWSAFAASICIYFSQRKIGGGYCK